MTYEPMPADRLCAVLAMTRPGWSTKARIVAMVGAHEGGAWLTAGDVAHWVGLSEGRARTVLRELTDARVILRDGGDGGRVFWTEVNPAVAEWRNVPWAVERRDLPGRLAWHAEQAMIGPAERFIARSIAARCHGVIARLFGARSGVDERATSRAKGPRDDGGGGGAHRAAKGARSGAPLRLVHGRAITPPAAVTRSSPTAADDGSVVVGHDPGPTTTVDPSLVNRAAAVLLRRALPAPGKRAPFLAESKKAELADLVDRHGIDAFIGATAAAEPDLVPGLLGTVAAVLDGQGDEEAADAANRAARLAQLHQRRAAILNRIEAWGEDAPESDHEALAECETEIDALEGRMAAGEG